MYLIILINLLTIMVALYFAKFPKNYNILHPKKVFIYLYLLVQVSGYFFALIITNIDGSYKITAEYLIYSSVLTLYALLIFLISYYLISLKIPTIVMSKIIKVPKFNVSFFRQLFIPFFVLGLVGLSIYFFKNGFILFQDGGYENKNHGNVGLGYARIMFGIGFTYALASFLLFDYNKLKFKIALFGTFVLGVFIFVIIGGGRASAIGFFITTILISLYYQRKQSSKKIFIFGVIFFFIIVLLTIIRYKHEFSLDILVLLLYQLQGSFSPIDSFAKIIEVVPNKFDYNLEMIFNSFLTLIPRTIWVDKPLEVIVPSVYFTDEILNYGTFVTISPTLLGELYMYNGLTGITFGMFVVAVIIRILSIIFIKSYRNPALRLFIIFKLFVSFALLREGISILLRDLFISTVIFFIILISIYTFNQILKTRTIS